MSASQRWWALAIVATAFLLRVWALDLKPAHFDEGVNGSFVDSMRQLGAYHYDPANYHGPLHFYVLFAGQQLFGRSLWALRMPTVLIGTAAVAMMLAFRRFLPFRAVAIAAAFAAVSPGLTFYSRYAIHEMWMPVFALMAVYGGCGLAAGERRIRDVWWVGMGLTGMILTKETYLLHFIAALLSLGAMWLFFGQQATERPTDLSRGNVKIEEPPLSFGAVGAVWLASIALILAFYSGFGFYWDGVRGLLDTFVYMQAKGTHAEAGHNKEILYWAKLLAYYEWPAMAGFLAAPLAGLPRARIIGGLTIQIGVALAVVARIVVIGLPATDVRPDYLQPNLGLLDLGSIGILGALAGAGFLFGRPVEDSRIRWMSLYGLASFAGYALIPYKTPWCVVNIVWPFCFIAGAVLDQLANTRVRYATLLLAALLGFASLRSACDLNFVHPTYDSLSPTREDRPYGDRYAYVQTTADINRLLQPVRALIANDATNRQMTGIILGEAYPLIWELNDLPNVLFETPETIRLTYDADFLLIPESRREEIEPQLAGIYFREPYQPRGGGEPSLLYLQAERFAPVLGGRIPEFRPRVPLTP